MSATDKAQIAKKTGGHALPSNPALAPAPTDLTTTGPLDLPATLYSGQAFRWNPAPDGHHDGFIQNQPCRIRIEDGRIRVQSASLAARDVVQYFRLDDSHDDFLRSAPQDAALQAAIARFPGLRILRQDPWEMLVSFIISQNSNEAKIRRTIESLCQIAGEPVEFQDRNLRRFPTAQAIARLDETALRSTGMGYRARYVKSAAAAVLDGAIEPHRLRREPYEEAVQNLLALEGVGPKVADCILLYGCDHLSAFPSDVWVRRFVRETYLRRRKNPSHDEIRGFALRRFGPTAGYAQHYLFHYRRSVGALPDNRS